jgi:peptidoglycan/xylan/chitin deacetylase (PgdA/CDA1 family)
MTQKGIVFLIYHELEIPGRSLCQAEPGYLRYVLSASDFISQMRLLKDRGWRGFSVSEALRFPPQPGVTITFDDGCETDLITAAAVLKETGFGATFYITSGFLGRKGYLSRAQLQQLCALGFEIGCHSMTHAYLTDLDQSSLQREIVEAKTRLEQIIAGAVEHFSCPGGRYDQRVTSVAEMAGYKSLATSRIQANSALTSHFELGRVAIMRNLSLTAFERICRARGLWQLNARDQLRLAARRAMGNKNYDRVRRALLR